MKQKLQADPLESGQTIAIGKTQIAITQESYLLAHGTDNDGKPWTLTSSAWMGSASVWTADLDKNGRADIIILMHTGGCGWAPNTQLLVLMFEQNGRPYPFIADGYFTVDSHGIKDFVDAENNGHSQLIRQSFDDGYWITSLYQAHAARWKQMGSCGGVPFPLYTRFTNSPNNRAITPPAFRHPLNADLSNVASNGQQSTKQTYLDDLIWARVERSEDSFLVLSNGKRCRPRSWYGSFSVILDEPSGRRIAALSAGEAVHRLLNEIMQRHIPVAIHGNRSRMAECQSVETLYAHAPANSRETSLQHPSQRRLDLSLSCAQNAELP